MSTTTYVRIDCGPSVPSNVGVDQVEKYDSIIVHGKLGSRLSCHHDGPDNFIIPLVLWKFENNTATMITTNPTYANYQNTVRVWGEVEEVITATQGSNTIVVAFLLRVDEP